MILTNQLNAYLGYMPLNLIASIKPGPFTMFGNGNPVKIQFIALLTFAGLVCFTKLNPSVHAQVPDSVAMTLVEPASEMPLYALSNVRFGTDRNGKPLIEFDYSTSRPGKQILAEAVIRPGNLPDGQKMIFGAIQPGANTFRLRLDEERFAQLKQHGVEIVIVAELTSSQGGSDRQQTSYHYFKLSNPITFGGATSTCSMRPVQSHFLHQISGNFEPRSLPSSRLSN